MAAILDFRSAGFKLFLIYKSSWCFLRILESIGLSVQEEIFKMAAILDLRSELPGILDIFDLQVTPMLPTKFWVSWLLGLGEVKNWFSRWPPWWPFWISDRHDFSFFFYKSSWCFLPSLESASFWVQEEKQKIDFQDGGHGSHLGFRFRMILAAFGLQVTPMLPTNIESIVPGFRRSRLLKKLLTTDIDWPQQLTMSTSCSGELIMTQCDPNFDLKVNINQHDLYFRV